MGKIRREPQPFIYPLPVALITCQESAGGSNIITVAWISNACASPPMVGLSLRPHRYSTDIIKETGEFGVNMPSAEIAYEVDLCGTLSGRDADKIRISGLTEAPASIIRAPLLAECAVNMECVTRQVIPLGSHLYFLAEVVALHVEEDLLSRVEDSEEEDDRRLELERSSSLVYLPEVHDYWTLGPDPRRLNHSSGKKP